MYEEYFYENVFTKDKEPWSMYHKTPSDQLKVIGKTDILRVDAGRKVTGALKFGGDVILPRMLYLRFMTAPYAHANVKSIDTSKAKALPGVVMVLTYDDIPDMSDGGEEGGAVTEYVLSKKVLHYGEEIAAVLAEEQEIADEAITLIRPEYEVLPFVLTPEDAIKPGAPVVRGTTNAFPGWKHTRGNVDAGFAAASSVVGPITYGVSKPLHDERKTAPIDVDECTAYWDGERLILYSWDKNRYSNHHLVMETLKLPFNKVNVPDGGVGVCYSSGRGGGRKTLRLAAYLAMKTGRPVKARFTTEQQFVCKPTQRRDHITFRAGVKSDGALTALTGSVLLGRGPSTSDGSNGLLACTQYALNVPNLYLEGKGVNGHVPEYGSIRCTVHPMPNMSLYMFLDTVAEAAGINPADFLLKNILTTSGPGGSLDNPNTDMDTNPMPAMLNKLIEVSGWRNKWKGWKTPMAVSGSKRRGIGIALNRCSHGGGGSNRSAWMKANADGSFTIVCGSQDIGQGARTTFSIMAAEELGVPVDKVGYSPADSSYGQFSAEPSGSAVTRSTGAAIILACRDMKEQLFKAAILDKVITATKPEDLEMSNGEIYLKANPATKIPLSRVTSRMPNVVGWIIARGSCRFPGGNTRYQWGSAVAEVEVDVDTGEVTVLQIYQMHDTGRTIWYRGAYSQAIGATEMSCGRAIMEAEARDETTGASIAANYLDYKLATQMDSPNISVNFHEEPSNYGPFGARGIGEPLVGAPAPAIAAAIYNAIGGSRIVTPPYTPDKILTALGKG